MHQLSRKANRIQKHSIHYNEVAKNDDQVYYRKSTNVVQEVVVRRKWTKCVDDFMKCVARQLDQLRIEMEFRLRRA